MRGKLSVSPRCAGRAVGTEEPAMNDASRQPLVYRPANKVRFVTAAALFDGHDA